MVGRMNDIEQIKKFDQSAWLPCRACGRRTDHAVLRKVRLEDESEEQLWEIVRCKGCKNIAFRQGLAWPNEFNQETGEYYWRWTVYPDPEFREEFVDKGELPEPVRRLYSETLIAFNHRAMTLAAAGLRAVVEATCRDQGCVKGTLEDKIEELVAKGVFLKRDADCLHQHRLLGNKAVHEMEAPSEEEFELALRILEHLLTTVYILPLLDQSLHKLRHAPRVKEQ